MKRALTIKKLLAKSVTDIIRYYDNNVASNIKSVGTCSCVICEIPKSLPQYAIVKKAIDEGKLFYAYNPGTALTTEEQRWKFFDTKWALAEFVSQMEIRQ